MRNSLRRLAVWIITICVNWLLKKAKVSLGISSLCNFPRDLSLSGTLKKVIVLFNLRIILER